MSDGELVYECGDRRRQRSRKVTDAGLRRAAQRYVERYGGPTAAVRATLERRLRRADVPPGREREQAEGWIDEILSDLIEAGALDDARWARHRAAILAERGTPTGRIRERLRQKRLAAVHIDAALEQLAAICRDPDLEAAIAYACRRGLGPFRRLDRGERRHRDLAAMARAGFSYSLTKRVIDASDERELLDWKHEPPRRSRR